MTAVPAGLAVLVAAVAAVALVASGGSGEEPPRGPLGTEDITGMGVPPQVGRPFSIGLPVVYNRGDEPATIDRISLVEKTPGIEVLETHVGGTDRATLLNASTYGWPDKSAYSDLHAPRGYVVPPERRKAGKRGVELVFVLELRDPGAHTFAGARVDYGIGSERYRTVLLDGARICAVRRLPETIEPDCDPIDLRDRTYD